MLRSRNDVPAYTAPNNKQKHGNQPKQNTSPPPAQAPMQDNNGQPLASRNNKPSNSPQNLPQNSTQDPLSPERSSIGDVFYNILQKQQMLEAKVSKLEQENRELRANLNRLESDMKSENPIDLNKAR